jgi:hypothetical protein
MARRRETMQQQEFRSASWAGLAVEHIAAVDLGGAVMDGGHVAFAFSAGNGPQPSTTSPIALVKDVDDGGGRSHERRVIDRMTAII